MIIRSRHQPLVQIVMAVFNGERYIHAQIESILSQTHSATRLIVRDNASTDATWQILRDYSLRHPDRIIVLPQSTENIGALGNFAAAFEAADPGYVMFSDADDIWLPDKVETVLSRMAELESQYGQTMPILVHSDLAVVDAELNLIDPSFWHYQKIDPIRGCRLGRLLVCNAVTGCTMMLNAPLVRLARPIPVREVVMHDYWIALLAAVFGRIGHVDRPLMKYRQHGRNDTGAKRWDGSLRGILGKPWNPFDHAATSRFRATLSVHIRQAQALLDRHGQNIPQSQKRAISAFVCTPNRSFVGRRLGAIRHGFWKTGLIRNISLLTRL